ncbi:ion transporter [Pirellulales bacterium]|nr:ion transporter [Pirellulales bacterium]
MTTFLRDIAESKRFQYGVLALIIFAAILVGIETSKQMTSQYGNLLHLLNKVVLWAFVVEALIKMGQHGRHFYRYFKDPWNIFDFAVIAVCFLPIQSQFAAVLRLARVFRSLRLVTAIPKLQLLVNALLISIPAMFYVGILLLLLFYVYGVMGVFLFRANDPVHFPDLATSMLTLFRVATQEDWTDVMYIQMYGSDVYPYVNTTDIEPVPSARPLLGAGFFVSFVFLGTMIMLNLFIGVILNSMEEVQQEHDSEKGDAIDDARGDPLARISIQLEALTEKVDALQQRREQE